MHGERRNELRPALDLNAKLPFLVTWCPRSESNRHAFKGGGFSYHFGFRRPAALGTRVRSLEHAFTVASWALGARRLLSTPSPGAPRGLARHQLEARGLRAFTEFDGLHRGDFSPRAQVVGLSPLRLPIPPLGHREARAV